MKRAIKYLSLLLMTVVFATGCGSDPKKNIETAFKKTSELDSFALDVKANINAMGLALPIKLSGEADLKNKIAHVNASLSMFGSNMKAEVYADGSDEKQVITYTKTIVDDEDSEWSKSISSDTNETSEFDSKKFEELLDKATKIEKVKSDDKENIKYQITVSAEDLKKLAEESKDEMEEAKDVIGDIDKESIKADLVIDIYVEKKSGYISKIYTDLSEFVKTEDEDEDNPSKVTISITLSKFNEVSELEIPQDVITNAVDEDADDDFDIDLDDDTTANNDEI